LANAKEELENGIKEAFKYQEEIHPRGKIVIKIK